MPKVESPQRPVFTAEEFAALRRASPRVHPGANPLLVLTHATGHRGSSVPQRQWDLELDARSHAPISWRAGADRMRRAHLTPLPEPAARLLRQRQRALASVGEAHVLPSDDTPHEPVGRPTVSLW